MKNVAGFATVFSVTAASFMFITACSNTPRDATPMQSPEAQTSATYNYHCESGEIIAATYHGSDVVNIQYKDNRYGMKIAMSGSGARYVNDHVEWWVKGSGQWATDALFGHNPDGTSGKAIEFCRGL